jgi:hydroxymethylbilane synthase
MPRIVVGSQGSVLALSQARWVAERLKEAWPEADFKVRSIRQAAGAGGADYGVGELEEALRKGEADMIVASLCEFAPEPPDGVALGAVTRRLDPREAWVSRGGRSLVELDPGARVGASGARVRAQLAALRSDLEFVGLEGDLGSRMARIAAGECDAVVVPAADLLRMDMRQRIDAYIETAVVMPAAGQGALGVEVREDDDVHAELAYALNDGDADDRTAAERAFMVALGVSIAAPVGALAVLGEDGRINLSGCVAAPDGSKVVRSEASGSREESEDIGIELAGKIRQLGADVLLARV